MGKGVEEGGNGRLCYLELVDCSKAMMGSMFNGFWLRGFGVDGKGKQEDEDC